MAKTEQNVHEYKKKINKNMYDKMDIYVVSKCINQNNYCYKKRNK